VAVYLTYAAPRGHALIDRALYPPRSWADDHDRCAAAGIPHAQQVFATKPTLAATLIDRAVAASVPAAWVAGDEVYGADPHLRAVIRGHGLGYVMAIAANRRVPTHAGPIRVDGLPPLIPAHAWQKHSAGAGAHGPRLYSWAWFRLLAEDDTDSGVHHFADPAQRRLWRARLPALLQLQARPVAHPGYRGRTTLAHRGILPSGQRPGWT
jgi:SRSO17 transposase